MAKKPTRKQIKLSLYIIGVLALMGMGVAGTLSYQSFINGVKREAVADYKINECAKYWYEDKSQSWFECEPKKLENDQ